MRAVRAETHPPREDQVSEAAPDFEAVFLAHHDRLVRLAGLLCGDARWAEDAVAEVFARWLRLRDRRGTGGKRGDDQHPRLPLRTRPYPRRRGGCSLDLSNGDALQVGTTNPGSFDVNFYATLLPSDGVVRTVVALDEQGGVLQELSGADLP